MLSLIGGNFQFVIQFYYVDISVLNLRRKTNGFQERVKGKYPFLAEEDIKAAFLYADKSLAYGEVKG